MSAPVESVPVEPAAGERIVVAMSGGVDSSVAAALLVERGYEVVGISMRLANERSDGSSSGCCSLEDFRDAGRVADALGIAHYTFDLRDSFREQVVEPFVAEYVAGRTPSPCIACNREIKFKRLRHEAAALGARFVATGHYARRVYQGGRYRLLRAATTTKDQSYFLFEMGQHELAHTLFPIGDLDKADVRRLAERAGLVTADKPESQEICFVPDGGYADFVEANADSAPPAGRIVDEEGRDLGAHAGIHRFTVGQRRGIGLASADPLYVTAVDAAADRIVVGGRSSLARVGLEMARTTWVGGAAPQPGERFAVRIRHRHRAVPCTLSAVADDRATVRFDDPEDAIAPGQAAVLYDGDEVVGGGWIGRALRAERSGEAAPCA